MLDFGWPELLVIMAVAVLVIGPKELPQIMRTLGRMMRRLQYARFAITQQFDDLLKDTELDDLRREAELRVIGDADTEVEADEAYMAPEMKPKKQHRKKKTLGKNKNAPTQS